MYRACSTWQYEVVAHLINQFHHGQRLGYLTGEQYAAVIKADASNRLGNLLHTRNWRVAKTHEGDRSFSRALAHGKAIAIYAHRDIREVVFSLMHKRGQTFEQLVRQGMLHQILANDRFWMAQPDVLIQRYDELIAEPARGIMEIARHLGIRLEVNEAIQIAGEYSHESNAARTAALRNQLRQAGVDLESSANAQICDPTTLLHWNHIRDGKTKTWNCLANYGQRLVLERLCGRWLRARGYSPGILDAGGVKISRRERLRIEIDLVLGRTNFLLRSASQRWPRTARSLKRILGIPSDAHVGATAWADPTASHQDVREFNPLHIPMTRDSAGVDRGLAGQEIR